MDGFVTSSMGMAAMDGVTILSGTKQFRQTVEILGQYFSDNVADIEATLAKENAQNASGETYVRSVLGCVDADGDVQAATICFVRTIPKAGLKIVEIVWFASRAKGNGWGNRLFRGVVEASKGIGADAILSTSTNSALRFWLTRTNIRMADAVIRNKDRRAIEWPRELGFKVVPAPSSSAMERLYTSVIVRNRKGRMVGDFEGKPYYYDVNTSNHVWYLLNRNLHMKSVTHKPGTRFELKENVPVFAPKVSNNQVISRLEEKVHIVETLKIQTTTVSSGGSLLVVESLVPQIEELSVAGDEEYPTPASTPSLPM